MLNFPSHIFNVSYPQHVFSYFLYVFSENFGFIKYYNNWKNKYNLKENSQMEKVTVLFNILQNLKYNESVWFI